MACILLHVIKLNYTVTSLQRDIISGIRTPPIVAFFKKTHLCYELEEFSLRHCILSLINHKACSFPVVSSSLIWVYLVGKLLF